MTGKKRVLGSDLEKVDRHVIQPHEYDEVPELTEDLIERGDLYHGRRLIRRRSCLSLPPRSGGEGGGPEARRVGGASAGEMPALTLTARPSPQHPGNPEVLVEVGPVNSHRHQFEAPARRGAGLAQPRIPLQRRRDPAAVGQRHRQFVGGEGNRDRPDIADVNFQSAHAICLRTGRAATSDDG